MKNKQKFLSKLKDAIFKSHRYDERITDLQKEKKDANRKAKNYILENKSMFKKRRFSDLFTEKVIKFFCFFNLSIFVLIFILSCKNIDTLDDLSALAYEGITTFFATLLIYFCALSMEGGIKNKKNKVLFNLKSLRETSKKKIGDPLKDIKIEKENISKMIEDFERGNNENNKQLLELPINANFLKMLSSHFSEDEIKTMLFIKSGEHISYYDILNFINKIENEEKYTNQARHIKQIEHSEEIYCAN